MPSSDRLSEEDQAILAALEAAQAADAEIAARGVAIKASPGFIERTGIGASPDRIRSEPLDAYLSGKGEE